MKLILLAAALVATMALGATSLRADDMASTNSMTTTTTTSTKMMKTPYKGTITSVDATGMKVMVKGAKGDMTLMVNDKTKFKGGKSLSDFAVGDKITGSYMKDDSGAMTACSIHKKM
jgi:hypothetical protein